MLRQLALLAALPSSCQLSSCQLSSRQLSSCQLSSRNHTATQLALPCSLGRCLLHACSSHSSRARRSRCCLSAFHPHATLPHSRLRWAALLATGGSKSAKRQCGGCRPLPLQEQAPHGPALHHVSPAVFSLPCQLLSSRSPAARHRPVPLRRDHVQRRQPLAALCQYAAQLHNCLSSTCQLTRGPSLLAAPVSAVIDGIKTPPRPPAAGRGVGVVCIAQLGTTSNGSTP